MKRCFIFGALPVKRMPVKPREGDFLIAADKGYDTALSLGLTPDITVGDFDSRGCAPDTEDIVRLPVRKDDTDVGHAVGMGFERGYEDFVVYGAVGGLLDHTLANIAIAHDIVRRGGRALFIGGEYSFTVISGGSFSFEPRRGGRISVFALGGTAHGVDISGLSYETVDIDLPCTSHLGVSNSFIGKKASVSVRDGVLLIVFQSE